MFFHNFKYAMWSLIKSKTALFWTLIFPIALGSFMYMAFANIFEVDELFKTIPIAVVGEQKGTDWMSLGTVLEQLDDGSEDSLLKITKTSEEKADKLLEQKKIQGIYFLDEERLLVAENTTNTTILGMVLEQYMQIKNVCMDMQQEHPEYMQKAIENITEEKTSIVERATTKGCQNNMYNYFYAIFAMSCMFASFSSAEKVSKMQANTSALGLRRCMSPHPKMIMVLSEFFALWCVQFLVELVTLAYLTILGVDFGDKYPAIALTLFVGSGIGLAMGVIVGSIGKFGEKAKIGILSGISMALSVMADLCAGGIKNLVEHSVPILNRINPAVLLSDCFYALNVYDNYDRFLKNISILSGMAAILLVISYFLIRRERYASL